MLPPNEMLAKKNRLPTRVWVGLLLVMFVAGCMAPGPRAMLKGKKLLDAGDYAAAVEQFRAATTLLPDNASAWNYLGVACQKARQPDNAVMAYQRALELNRDLVEVHWNLGMLWLEQNKNDKAVSEFTTYTLRRNNQPDGWLKLGAAQLRLGEIVPAESSFSWVLKLDPRNPEAMNGLGLACLERSRPGDAVKWFAAAIQSHPGFVPATLNLAVTAQQYLHDDKLALQYYHVYLDLNPRPDNWEDVSEIANTLEQAVAMTAVPPPPPVAENQTPPVTQPQPVVTQPEIHRSPAYVPRTPPTTTTRPQPVIGRASPTPPPSIRSTPPANTVARNQPPPARQPAPTAQIIPVVSVQSNPQPVETPESSSSTNAEPAKKHGFWQKLNPAKWFQDQPMDQKYANSGFSSNPTNDVTPIPAVPVDQIHPEAPSFPRYSYLSTARPAPGDRTAAAGAFTRARVAEQASQWVDAMQAYHTAAEFDPSWFEAQYNYGVLSYRLGDQKQALEAYQMALAIQPDSVDARYNFALALKAADYVPDAIKELKKVLETNPDEIRAHLALANLYAQKMHDIPQAREHYQKVLDLDPGNPQAPDIRYWLSLNQP